VLYHDSEVDQRKLGKRLCKKDCQARKLNREYAMDRSTLCLKKTS